MRNKKEEVRSRERKKRQAKRRKYTFVFFSFWTVKKYEI